MFEQESIFNLHIHNAVQVVMEGVRRDQGKIGKFDVAAEVKGNFEMRIVIFGNQAVAEQKNVVIVEAGSASVS